MNNFDEYFTLKQLAPKPPSQGGPGAIFLRMKFSSKLFIPMGVTPFVRLVFFKCHIVPEI